MIVIRPFPFDHALFIQAGHKLADVVLGVVTLSPGYLIEVDAIAIID